MSLPVRRLRPLLGGGERPGCLDSMVRMNAAERQHSFTFQKTRYSCRTQLTLFGCNINTPA